MLLPVIAGVAYELIRFAGKHSDNRVLMTLLAPGLWLQRLTTREPSLDQLEVSIRALREVLDLEGRQQPADRRVEVMAYDRTDRERRLARRSAERRRHDRRGAERRVRAARRVLGVTVRGAERKTSPEELIASAWAACFAMALSNGLAKGGTPPERLETSATVTFQPGEGIIKGALTVRGTVPGLDEAGFAAAAEDAARTAPSRRRSPGSPT